MDAKSQLVDLVSCPACGEDTPARFRLCGFCGTPLAGAGPLDEVHRFVTVVNSDLKGSTALGEKLDPESLREVLTRYFDEMRAVFERGGGTIEKIIGDAIVAVFGMPVQRDDDAIRAIAAAGESMQVLAELNDQLEAIWGVRLTTRTGVSTGYVTVGALTASQHVLTGDTMRVSSAMEQNAPPFGVLIAQPTYELVRDLVVVEPSEPVVPKGTNDPVEAYRLVEVRPHALEAAAGQQAARGDDGSRYCANCGEANPSRQRLCGMCGAPLVVAAAASESRKTVTLVFADPKPRTESGEPPSPDATRDVMSRYFEAMRVALERHGATVEKFIGDAVMAVFGLPARHEDDALRAIRAALDMQAALPALNEEFSARWGVRLLNAIGVNTGEVIAGDASLGQRLVTGDAVNVAARLEQAAGPAEVIIGALTYRLVKDYAEVEAIEPLTLKGKAQPVPAYRLLAVRDQPMDTLAGGAPFVGRETEMLQLTGALAEVTQEHVVRLLTVVGDAGVGKSRLIKEFASRAGVAAHVLRGRCLPYGDGITFWPVAEVVREAAAIAGDDTPESAAEKIERILQLNSAEQDEREEILERVTAAIGLSDAQFPVSELFWGIRRLLEALGREQPLVLLIDDIHSAEQTLLDLLDHLVDAGHESMIMVLCSARHELLERHEAWSEAHAPAMILLEPLSDADSGRMVGELLGQTGLDESVVARIATAAEGNPLFVEQMVSMLIDTGALQQVDERWVATAAATDIAIPPSIHALLAARFDSLGSDERRVLEPASVIGLSFAVAAIDALAEDADRDSLDRNLVSLDHKQFVKPTTLDEDAAYRFAHILVRDTAYGSLLKRARARYHERFVDWAERINAERGRGQEFEEIHGYHLEQAFRYRTELGVMDDAAKELGRRAATKLASAGRRAFARGDMPAAVNLLGRAQGLLPETDETRIGLLPDLGEALQASGNRERATAVLEDAEQAATTIGDERLLARARAFRVLIAVQRSLVTPEEAIAEAERDIAIFEASGDEAGLAHAWRLPVFVHMNGAHFDDASAAAGEAMQHALAAAEPRLVARAAQLDAYSLLLGSLPVDEALERCAELSRAVEGDRKAEAYVAGITSVLLAMSGEFARARELYAWEQQTLASLGPSVMLSSTSLHAARVELLAGDPVSAEREARGDFDALGAIDETYFRSTVAGFLARALLEQERYDDADAMAVEARELSADDDVESQLLWRGVAARLLARRGLHDEALVMAESELKIAETISSPVYQADARTDAADVLVAMGRLHEAAPHLREALRLLELKGDATAAARVRSRLDEIASS